MGSCWDGVGRVGELGLAQLQVLKTQVSGDFAVSSPPVVNDYLVVLYTIPNSSLMVGGEGRGGWKVGGCQERPKRPHLTAVSTLPVPCQLKAWSS